MDAQDVQDICAPFHNRVVHLQESSIDLGKDLIGSRWYFVERRTWARLRIRVAGRFASRLWDRETASERQTLYIPAFPLAQWLIANWWSVLFEPNVADDVPPS
jgi:hypothetical protein